jgi:hypothetical protein
MISIVLRNLAKNHSKHAILKGFKVHVCLDNNIFMDEIEEMVKHSSVFVIIPVRLGLESI